ncbi:hypothetical protein FRB99_000364, partial [Tulasnella sp. 403]
MSTSLRNSIPIGTSSQGRSGEFPYTLPAQPVVTTSYRKVVQIVFKGGDGTECEDFIQSVRKYAFSEGKLDDKAWTALFASTCFSGKALRWHVALDNNTKTNWDLLEAALLEEWPPVASKFEVPCGTYDISASSIVPNPASIVTLPAPPPTIFRNTEGCNVPLNGDAQASRPRRGMIQVHVQGHASPIYIEGSMLDVDFYIVTLRRGSGSVFEYTGKQLRLPGWFRMPNLCIHWSLEPPFESPSIREGSA